MSVLPYHKRYHSDALAGFMPLTLEERGAYQTLLDMIYDRGGPLIDNERLLAGYMNCSLRKWRQIRENLIAKGKIRINADGQITNRRAQKEIENTTKTQRKLIEAGAKGGRKRAENEKKDNENNEVAQASLEPALSDPQAILEARSQKGSVDKSTGVPPSEIDRKSEPPPDPRKLMFDAGIDLLCGAKVPERQARALIGKWCGHVGEDEVRLGIAEAKIAGIVDPVPWLSKRFSGSRRPNSSGQPHRNHEDLVLERIERERRHQAASG